MQMQSHQYRVLCYSTNTTLQVQTTLCNLFSYSRKHTFYNSKLLLHWGSTSILSIPLWSAVQQDMGLWPMNGIMHPSSTLLYSQGAPFCFRHETPFRNLLCNLWRKNNVSIFVNVVIVSLRVLNTVGCHDLFLFKYSQSIKYSIYTLHHIVRGQYVSSDKERSQPTDRRGTIGKSYRTACSISAYLYTYQVIQTNISYECIQHSLTRDGFYKRGLWNKK